MSMTSPLATDRSDDRNCAGIDWSNTDHAVCILGPGAVVLDRFVIAHTAPGLRRLITALRKAGVSEVGIERCDGPVVDALLAAEFTVLVIAPAQVKNLRSRYGSAGNKDDHFDAYVLADTVRTDRARRIPLRRDTDATIAMRAMVRARRDLVATRVAICNQLLAHLQLVFPGAIGLFSDLDAPISLNFLTKYANQAEADQLTEKRLAAWLKSISYSGGTDVAVLHARLTTATRGTTGAEAATHATVTRSYVTVLQSLVAQINALETNLAVQLTTHPDTHIFASLPRVATLRTARLIGEIGDCRGRFPTPEALAALAGVVPSTRQSGRVKNVTFRYACNRQLRDTLCDFADGSRRTNPWAADLYNRAKTRGHDHQHAIRILARAWTYIIWRCWQDNQPYNPNHHRALQTLTTPQAA
jgi:transposase